MSSIRKRPNSKYYWWDSQYEGKRLRKSTKMKKKSLAKKIQDRWDYSVMTGDLEFYGISDKPSSNIDNFFDHFLQLRSRKSEKTFKSSKSIINRFRLYLSDNKVSRIDKISVTVLDKYIDFLQCKPKSKKNYLVEISLLLNQAIREELISSNPAKFVTLPVIKCEGHRLLDDDDLNIIFAGAGRWSLYYLTLLHTGLRSGDVAMLKYGNIDREKGAIISLVRKSRRIHEFPLTNQLINEIPNLDGNTPIFPDLYETNEIKLGTKMSTPRKHMQALLKAENRKHATLHSFRVTYNNQLRDFGCSIEDRQILLAHSTSETTKIYTHPNFELAQRYINLLPNYAIKQM
jgi:integrase